MKTPIRQLLICFFTTVLLNSCVNPPQQNPNRDMPASADLTTPVSNTSQTERFFEGKIEVRDIQNILKPYREPNFQIAGICLFRYRTNNEGGALTTEHLRVLQVKWDGNDNFKFVKADGSLFEAEAPPTSQGRSAIEPNRLRGLPIVSTTRTDIPVDMVTFMGNMPDFDFVFFDFATISYLCDYNSDRPRLRAKQIKFTRVTVDASQYGKYYTLRACPIPDPLTPEARSINPPPHLPGGSQLGQAEIETPFSDGDAVAFGIGFACPPGWAPVPIPLQSSKSKAKVNNYTHGQLIYSGIFNNVRKSLTLNKLHRALDSLKIIPKQ